jgi:predicted XRE-type DNA-binding protein
MSRRRYSTVWDAIEESPAEAENMKLRAVLMTALRRYIETEGLSQTAAAERLGVTQPRISDLMRGKIDLFALDGLVTMASAAGLKVTLRVAKAA